jgi:hypothetical protein
MKTRKLPECLSYAGMLGHNIAIVVNNAKVVCEISDDMDRARDVFDEYVGKPGNWNVELFKKDPQKGWQSWRTTL